MDDRIARVTRRKQHAQVRTQLAGLRGELRAGKAARQHDIGEKQRHLGLLPAVGQSQQRARMAHLELATLELLTDFLR